ncbi:MAG: aspartate carbamoyltransferase regulatory subunit [Bacteroidota bacterium]
MKEIKKLQVSAIKNGTVIDHIPANALFNVLSILNLKEVDTQISFGTNLDSSRMGKKGIIKVEDKYFKDSEINKIALVARQAKLNIIKEYDVVDKRIVEIPDEIIGIAKCVNPQCITNHERITTKFSVISKEKVTLLCRYCEKITDQEHIEII